MMFRRAYFVSVIVAAAIAAGCDKSPLTAPAGSTVNLSAQDRVLPIGGSTQVQATVIESAGTPVQNGTTVQFSTTLGRVDPPEAQTHNGIAVTTFRAGDSSGIAEIRASSGGAGAGTSTTPTSPTTGNGNGNTNTTPTPSATTASNVVQITVGSAAVKTVTLTANPATVSANGGTVQLLATVAGEGGRLLSNISVAFTATRGTLSSATAITDANGQARVTLTTNGDTDITAAAGGATPATAKVTAQPGPSIALFCAAGTTTPTTSTNCSNAIMGDIVTFLASKNTGSSVLASSTLDFGDGQSVSLGSLSSASSVPHRYSQTGTFNARLTATDINGITDTVTQVVNVDAPSAPVVPTLILTNSGRTVTAVASVDPGTATVLTYDWTFGSDGTPPSLTTTEREAQSTYAGSGPKTVTVKVTLSDKRSGTTSKQITLP